MQQKVGFEVCAGAAAKAALLHDRVGSKEQVAQRPPTQVGQSPAPQVLGSVVDQMAALAPGCEIPVAIEAGVVLAVTGRQDWHCQSGPRQRLEPGFTAQAPSPAGAPMPGLSVEPGAVGKTDDHLPMRAPAGFAASAGAAEADHRRELWPVDRVEVAVFGADRHDEATLPRPS